MNIYGFEFAPNDHTMRPRMEKNEKQVVLLLKKGATELFTVPSQSHNDVVLYGKDLISADGKIKIRGYGPAAADAQGITCIFGPWRNQKIYSRYFK